MSHVMQHYEKRIAGDYYFKLPCPAKARDRCEWFHEEWRIPRYYMKDSTIDEYGSFRMKAITDNSGTWRVKYGRYETVYHVGESDY